MEIDRKEAMDRLGEAIERTTQRQELFTTLMLRLSGLHAVRRHLGFAAADRVATEAHRRLQQTLAPGDWLGRVSDDDFIIVSFDCNSPSCAIKGSEASLRGLGAPVVIDDMDCDLDPHGGIAIYPVDGATPDALMRHALTAVDQAKERGSDPRFAFFSHDLGQRAREDFVLQQALRRAISKSEFCVHLQPKFQLGTGQLIGAEALLRWPNPDGSLRPPSEFIPVAERGRLMRPLGRWVFNEALRLLASWRERGLPAVPLAINVAADQLGSDEWVAGVQSQVDSGLARPSEIYCEITESVALNDGEDTTARLQSLHDMGFAISVDDFGTGYSNLAALARFPFDEVKIDRSLVAGLGADESRERICRAATTLCHDLGMAVLAEGVETPSQAQLAQELGCVRAQGFLYGRPIAVEDFEARWLSIAPASSSAKTPT